MLLVLAAPSKHDHYYKNYFQEMIDFFIIFAKEIHGRDNVIVLTDKDTIPYFQGHLPAHALLTVSERLDPWIRDVSPVMPETPIQFRYYGGLKKKDAKYFQKEFNQFINRYNISCSKVNLINDGGNLIFNECDCVIITDKFLQLNNLEEAEGVSLLKNVLQVKDVVIVPADEEKLGHVDGMCTFINQKTLFVNSYEDDGCFSTKLMSKLQRTLPKNIEIINVVNGESSIVSKDGYSSAYGVYVNCVSTENYIYIPIFGNNALDEQAKAKYMEYSEEKTCVFINVSAVCHLGGSLHCLSWQVTGDNAEKLKNAAKTNPPF